MLTLRTVRVSIDWVHSSIYFFRGGQEFGQIQAPELLEQVLTLEFDISGELWGDFVLTICLCDRCKRVALSGPQTLFTRSLTPGPAPLLMMSSKSKKNQF
jgi:hypothetical protein